MTQRDYGGGVTHVCVCLCVHLMSGGERERQKVALALVFLFSPRFALIKQTYNYAVPPVTIYRLSISYHLQANSFLRL